MSRSTARTTSRCGPHCASCSSWRWLPANPAASASLASTHKSASTPPPGSADPEAGGHAGAVRLPRPVCAAAARESARHAGADARAAAPAAAAPGCVHLWSCVSLGLLRPGVGGGVGGAGWLVAVEHALVSEILLPIANGSPPGAPWLLMRRHGGGGRGVCRWRGGSSCLPRWRGAAGR